VQLLTLPTGAAFGVPKGRPLPKTTGQVQFVGGSRGGQGACARAAALAPSDVHSDVYSRAQLRAALSPTTRDSVTGVRAYVDESVRENAPGLYVLAAVVVDVDQAEALRAGLQAALLPGEQRLHWHDEGAEARARLANVCGSPNLLAVVAVSTPMQRTRQERARALCLTGLLWELAGRDVPEVVLESRRQRDRHDRSTIGAAKQARAAHPALHFEHRGPLQEPLLWLSDVVAGAVALDRLGQGAYLEALGGSISVVEVAGAG